MSDRIRGADLDPLPDDVQRWFGNGGITTLTGGIGGYGLTYRGSDDYLVFAKGYRAAGLTLDQVVAWGRGQFDPAPVMHASHEGRVRFDPGPLNIATGQTFQVGRNYNLDGAREVSTPGDTTAQSSPSPSSKVLLIGAAALALLLGRRRRR